jgi:hypothetical protein
MIQGRDAKGRIVKTNGRSTGSKNKRPNIHALLPPDAVQQLYTALFQLALAGDTAASRLLLDRLDPAPKGRPVELPEVPPIDGIESAQQAGRRVLETMLAGELSPDEAGQVITVIMQQVVGLEARDWSRMLEQLQERNRG